MSKRIFVKVDNDKCTGCGICEEECVFEAIVIENDLAKILDTCSGCLACTQFCPNEALSESQESPRIMLRQKSQLSKEQLLGAIPGAVFPGANTKKVVG